VRHYFIVASGATETIPEASGKSKRGNRSTPSVKTYMLADRCISSFLVALAVWIPHERNALACSIIILSGCTCSPIFASLKCSDMKSLCQNDSNTANCLRKRIRAASARIAMEHGPRGDLVAKGETSSSGRGLLKSPKADFREAMRPFPQFCRGQNSVVPLGNTTCLP
jgi:hypothetical protein